VADYPNLPPGDDNLGALMALVAGVMVVMLGGTLVVVRRRNL
jgi:hypothetical protein